MEKIALLCILITSILAASSRSGLSGDFLRELLMRSQNDANELARRMVALDVDPYELTLSDPALVRHLQRQCTLCDNRECCLQAFARESSGAVLRDNWRDYCPNALALDMLVGLQSRSRTVVKYS